MIINQYIEYISVLDFPTTISFCIFKHWKWAIPSKFDALPSIWIFYSLYIQGLSKFHAIAGTINCLFCNPYLTILLVVALLAEHSFWFSGQKMEDQLPHAIKSFKSQKHITISILKSQVETAFNNAIDQGDPAWLIQWIISHRLVCDIFFTFMFQTLTC